MQRATASEQQSFYFPYAMLGFRQLFVGENIVKDETQALHFLNIADENGCGFATFLLTGHFADKLSGLEAEVKEIEENQSATEAVSSSVEIKQLKEKVYSYAYRANTLGSMQGKYNLALCYSWGHGVSEDTQQYLTLLHQSAEMGYSQAIEDLAEDYQYSFEGALEPDFIHSLKLYFESFRRGKISALSNFNLLIAENGKNLEFMTIAYNLCKQCLQGHLFDNKSDSAIMGLFYKEGILVPKNMKKAIICLVNLTPLL